MEKLIRGIVDFRKNIRPSYKETFARLALGQRPDTLFIACSDSRVVPNFFASSNPGDLFVIRNVGNLIPPCGADGFSSADESEAAAIEFSLLNLPITDVIVCGHSECGAMAQIASGKPLGNAPNLKNWLRHGEKGFTKLNAGKSKLGGHLELHNQLSQINVLEQIEHLKSYPIVSERFNQGRLRLHGWWFDIKEAEVCNYDAKQAKFRVIDDEYVKSLVGTPPGKSPEKGSPF